MKQGVTEWGAAIRFAGTYNENNEFVSVPMKWFKTRNLRHRYVQKMKSEGVECYTSERTIYLLPY